MREALPGISHTIMSKEASGQKDKIAAVATDVTLWNKVDAHVRSQTHWRGKGTTSHPREEKEFWSTVGSRDQQRYIRAAKSLYYAQKECNPDAQLQVEKSYGGLEYEMIHKVVDRVTPEIVLFEERLQDPDITPQEQGKISTDIAKALLTPQYLLTLNEAEREKILSALAFTRQEYHKLLASTGTTILNTVVTSGLPAYAVAENLAHAKDSRDAMMIFLAFVAHGCVLGLSKGTIDADIRLLKATGFSIEVQKQLSSLIAEKIAPENDEAQKIAVSSSHWLNLPVPRAWEEGMYLAANAASPLGAIMAHGIAGGTMFVRNFIQHRIATHIEKKKHASTDS